jgi:hypothetical protein
MLYALCANVRNKMHMKQLCQSAIWCRGNRLYLNPDGAPFESRIG